MREKTGSRIRHRFTTDETEGDAGNIWSHGGTPVRRSPCFSTKSGTTIAYYNNHLHQIRDECVSRKICRTKRLSKEHASLNAKRKRLSADVDKKLKQKAAEIVNKLLYPEYKSGNLSKDDFKRICKDVRKLSYFNQLSTPE